MIDPNEIWQAKVNGEIYETAFGELVTWIAESSLLETDQVRRGNLRWLDAGRVPTLREFFEAKKNGTEPPFVEQPESVTSDAIDEEIESVEVQEIEPDPESEVVESLTEDEIVELDGQIAQVTGESANDICSVHPELPSFYVCESCDHAFCKSCPQGYGASVRICPYCGAMCNRIQDFESRKQQEVQYRGAVSEGFTFGDFGKALSYPFQFKSSLFFGGLLFAFFSLGQLAVNMGSIFFAAGALICLMLANALTFGVLANIIDNFSQGYTDRDFLPSFEDFSLWDDVVHPFFLSVAVYVSSFGLFVILVVGLVWYAWSTFSNQVAKGVAQKTSMTMPDKKSTQSVDHVRKLMEKYKRQNAERRKLQIGPDGLTAGQRSSIEEEAEFMRLNDMAKNYRKDQMESVIGKTPETQQKEMKELIVKFAKFAGPFLLLAGLAFIWGVIYFPAACAVAGYTRSFKSTLNPILGLDTIRHLGIDYLKILVMVFLISLMSGMIAGILGAVLSPFNIPRVGNIPAQFLGSFSTFYFSVAFAVTLGYALYKNAEKLNLYKG